MSLTRNALALRSEVVSDKAASSSSTARHTQVQQATGSVSGSRVVRRRKTVNARPDKNGPRLQVRNGLDLLYENSPHCRAHGKSPRCSPSRPTRLRGVDPIGIEPTASARAGGISRGARIWSAAMARGVELIDRCANRQANLEEPRICGISSSLPDQRTG